MINRGKAFLYSAAAGAAALITVVAILAVQLNALKSHLEKVETQYRTQLDDDRQQMDEYSQNLQIVASGSNEVRRYMNLPEKKLLSSAESSSVTAEDPAVSFYDAFRFLASEVNLEKQAGDFTLWLEKAGLNDYYSKAGYTLDRTDSTTLTIKKNDFSYLTIEYNGEKKIISFTDISGNSFSIPEEKSDIRQDLDQTLVELKKYDSEVRSTADSLEKLAGGDEYSEILKSRGLIIKPVDKGEFQVINKKDKSLLGSFGQNGAEYSLNGKMFSLEGDFKTALTEFLSKVDTETQSEKTDRIVLEKMEQVFSDEGFKVLLESESCSPNLVKEEDNEFIYFHIYRKDGTVEGSFALQKGFGEVLLISGDGKYLKSLNMFTDGKDFKSLLTDSAEKDISAVYNNFDDSSETFLVVGTHEHNADTMILVNANNRTGKINMVSFPRDLYYKGNKVNNIYREYGPEQLCRDLSKITGLNIRKYISIDMFAFVDVVNILGGIDVTLDSDLVDPTYKVKNNGVWSTLYYRKGTHHLDGVEALRVARSRHGSEAYDRSRRQQLVVKAIMDKMKSIDAGDISKVYDFVTSVFSYIDTNLNIADLVKDFAMYKDNKIEDPVTMNLDNILDAKWTNTYLLPPDEEKKLLADENFFKGQWIVVPKNNDWSLFNKFLEKVFVNGN